MLRVQGFSGSIPGNQHGTPLPVELITPCHPLCRCSMLSSESDFCQGPPGTGKTTSILALAHGLLGANYREGVLELNASDDRSTTLQT